MAPTHGRSEVDINKDNEWAKFVKENELTQKVSPATAPKNISHAQYWAVRGGARNGSK
jgi:hypothetical protein